MSSFSMDVSRSSSAPGIARRRVLCGLGEALPAALVDDVALLVSELVTNSVRHAHVGGGVIRVEALLLSGRLRLTVSDPGGETLPRAVTPDFERPGGFGLFLVDTLSSSWGIEREPDGNMHVWCEFMFDDSTNQAAGQP